MVPKRTYLHFKLLPHLNFGYRYVLFHMLVGGIKECTSLGCPSTHPGGFPICVSAFPGKVNTLCECMIHKHVVLIICFAQL